MFFPITYHPSPITFCQAIADADFCFYVQAEGRETLAQTIDVDVKALRVEGHCVAPSVAPDFFGEDESFDVAHQARDNQKLFERQFEHVPAAGHVVIVVLDAQVAVVVHLRFRACSKMADLRERH
jgi:hypothetical protein